MMTWENGWQTAGQIYGFYRFFSGKACYMDRLVIGDWWLKSTNRPSYRLQWHNRPHGQRNCSGTHFTWSSHRFWYPSFLIHSFKSSKTCSIFLFVLSSGLLRIPAPLYSIRINQFTLISTISNCGVPLGSVPYPLLLTQHVPLYSTHFSLKALYIDYHLYVDDIQLFLLFDYLWCCSVLDDQ